MFLHVSVCSQGGRGVVSEHALQVSGGWYPSMPCRSQGGCIPACLAGFQAHTQGGAWGVWLGWGGGSPGLHPGGSWGVWPGWGSPCPHLGGLQAHTQGGKLRGLAWGVSRPTPGGSPGPHPGGSPGPNPGGLQAHTWGGVSRLTPAGGCIPAYIEADPPLTADSYCCGRYASYWNAFLYSCSFSLLREQVEYLDFVLLQILQWRWLRVNCSGSVRGCTSCHC